MVSNIRCTPMILSYNHQNRRIYLRIPNINVFYATSDTFLFLLPITYQRRQCTHNTLSAITTTNSIQLRHHTIFSIVHRSHAYMHTLIHTVIHPHANYEEYAPWRKQQLIILDKDGWVVFVLTLFYFIYCLFLDSTSITTVTLFHTCYNRNRGQAQVEGTREGKDI